MLSQTLNHVAAGIFIPTMAIGAAGGRLAGRGMRAAAEALGLPVQVRRARALRSRAEEQMRSPGPLHPPLLFIAPLPSSPSSAFFLDAPPRCPCRHGRQSGQLPSWRATHGCSYRSVGADLFARALIGAALQVLMAHTQLGHPNLLMLSLIFTSKPTPQPQPQPQPATLPPRLCPQTVLIVSETSGSGPALVPMILACTISKLVADALCP